MDQVDQEQRRGDVFAQHRCRERDAAPSGCCAGAKGTTAARARSSRCRCGPRRPTATRRVAPIRTARWRGSARAWRCRGECGRPARAPDPGGGDQRLEQQRHCDGVAQTRSPRRAPTSPPRAGRRTSPSENDRAAGRSGRSSVNSVWNGLMPAATIRPHAADNQKSCVNSGTASEARRRERDRPAQQQSRDAGIEHRRRAGHISTSSVAAMLATASGMPWLRITVSLPANRRADWQCRGFRRRRWRGGHPRLAKGRRLHVGQERQHEVNGENRSAEQIDPTCEGSMSARTYPRCMSVKRPRLQFERAGGRCHAVLRQ